MSPELVDRVGPFVGGAPGWGQLTRPALPARWGQPDPHVAATKTAWSALKEAVDSVFGMTKLQREDRFYAMQPTKGERGAQFVLRVQEAKRRLNLDDTTVFHVFVHRLPADLHNKLELLRITSVGNSAKLDWKTVVRLARDELRGTSLGMPVVSQPDTVTGGVTSTPDTSATLALQVT